MAILFNHRARSDPKKIMIIIIKEKKRRQLVLVASLVFYLFIYYYYYYYFSDYVKMHEVYTVGWRNFFLCVQYALTL